MQAALPCAALVLGACAREKQNDCPTEQELQQCIDRVAAKGQTFSWDSCLPYSEPSQITGIHIRDFEQNVFLEGATAVPAQPWSTFPVPHVKLDLERPARTDAEGRKLATVSRLRFTGRRPLCVATPEESWLMVDKVLSEEIIESKPSEFQ